MAIMPAAGQTTHILEVPSMIIDVHTHIVPEEFPPVGSRASGDQWPYMDHTEPGSDNVMIGGRNFRTVVNRCWDADRRVKEMPAEGIDRQVLSPMPELLAYQLPAEDGRDMGRYLSEVIARMMDKAPDHFYGLGAVPMQNAELATKELSYIKGLGLQGVEIMTNINGKNLGDDEFRPFLKEAESLGLSILVHGQRPTFSDRFVGPGLLENAIGFPIENALAIASVITGKVLEDCPNLRMCFSHGGGVFAQLLARMENAWNKMKPMKDHLPKPPSEYAKMMYYDDIFFNMTALRFLIDTVGISQVVVGSDYPFMFRDPKPQEEFDALNLTTEEREAISSANCLRFLGIAT